MHKKFYQQIQRGTLQHHQDCNVTIPNKTFYGSCIMFDKGKSLTIW